MSRTSRRAYVARNSSVEPILYVEPWPGMVTPPTISPRIDWLQYSPLASSDTIGRRNVLSGSDEQISWRIGYVGTSTPTSFASCGDHAPVALITRRARTAPRGVCTT